MNGSLVFDFHAAINVSQEPDYLALTSSLGGNETVKVDYKCKISGSSKHLRHSKKIARHNLQRLASNDAGLNSGFAVALEATRFNGYNAHAARSQETMQRRRECATLPSRRASTATK